MSAFALGFLLAGAGVFLFGAGVMLWAWTGWGERRK